VEPRGAELISRNREAFSELVAIPLLPKPELLAMANNKWSFYRFCQEHQFPTVPTVAVRNSAGPVPSVGQIDCIEFPALLKPQCGSGGSGIVKVEKHSDLYLAWDDERIRKDQKYILQSHVPGVDFSFSVLAEKGKIVAFALWQPLVPAKKPFGISEGIEYVNDEKVIDVGSRVVSAMEWDGVADIDLIVDRRDQTIKILEFNPRFWGTLLGCLVAGMNFPLMLCLRALGIMYASRQRDFTRYASLSVGAKMLFSKDIGRSTPVRIRWQECRLRFTCGDPLPEIVTIVRKTTKRLSQWAIFKR